MALNIAFKGSASSVEGDSLLLQDVKVSIGSILLVGYVGKESLTELKWGADTCIRIVSVKHSTLGVIELWYLKPQTGLTKDVILKSAVPDLPKLMVVGELPQLLTISNYVVCEAKAHKAVVGPLQYSIVAPSLAMAIVFAKGQGAAEDATWDGVFIQLPTQSVDKTNSGEELTCRMGYTLVAPGNGVLKLGLNFPKQQHFSAIILLFQTLGTDKFVGTEIEIFDYVPKIDDASDSPNLGK